MNQDQSIHSAGGDQVGGKHGFSEGGGGREHAGIVSEHSGGGDFLFGTESAAEMDFEWCPGHSLISDQLLNFQLREKC